MKKLMLPLAAVLVLASCSKESANEIENQDVSEMDVAQIEAQVAASNVEFTSEAEAEAWYSTLVNYSDAELSLYFELLSEKETENFTDATGKTVTAYEKGLIKENMLSLRKKAVELARNKFGKSLFQLSEVEFDEMLQDNQISMSSDIVGQQYNYEALSENLGIEESDETNLSEKASCPKLYSYSSVGTGYSNSGKGAASVFSRRDSKPDCDWRVKYNVSNRSKAVSWHPGTYSALKWFGRLGERNLSGKTYFTVGKTRMYITGGSPWAIKGQ